MRLLPAYDDRYSLVTRFQNHQVPLINLCLPALSLLCSLLSACAAFVTEHGRCIAERKSIVVSISDKKELLLVPLFSSHGAPFSPLAKHVLNVCLSRLARPLAPLKVHGTGMTCGAVGLTIKSMMEPWPPLILDTPP